MLPRKPLSLGSEIGEEGVVMSYPLVTSKKKKQFNKSAIFSQTQTLMHTKTKIF